MTDPNNSETRPAYEGGDGPIIDHDPNEKPKPRTGRSLSQKVGLALVAVIGIGAVFAQAAGGSNDRGWGPGWGGRFAEHRLYAVLDDIGASDTQQDQIWAVIDRTRSQMRPLGREFFETRGQLAALLSAPSIDTAAIEKLRSERISAVDGASKAWVSAMVEAAQVLTPEQRAKLADEIKDHRSRW
jgi:protein CpxP